MSELSELERRVEGVEKDVKELYKRTDCTNVWQAKNGEKLDNVLIVIGELKEAISSLKSAPGKRWDALIFGIIGAAGAAIVALIVKFA
jgi:hypothetical protein